MVEPYATLTGFVPACFLARLEARGFAAPYSVDPDNPMLIRDGSRKSVGIAAPITLASEPTLDREFTAFVAGALNLLTAEARAIRNPLDGPHLQAVPQESRAKYPLPKRDLPNAAE